MNTIAELAQAINSNRKGVYARAQDSGHSLEEMQAHRSSHGYYYDDETEEECEHFFDGVCCIEVGSHDAYFGGSPAPEVVIFEGRYIEAIYDGDVVYPTKIIARITREEYELLVEMI